MSKECFERFKESYEEILPMPSLDNEEIYKYCFALNESSKMVSMEKESDNSELYNKFRKC